MFHRATKRMLRVRGENLANGRALSLGLDLEDGGVRFCLRDA
jgi:hypothetical protein